MSVTAQRWRLTLFCVCAVALLLAALSFSSSTPGPSLPSPPALAVPVQPVGGARPIGTQVKPDARRFLAAFLRYEAGKVGPPVRRALRATATPTFAGELLDSPPRLVGGGLPPARLERLTITAIPVTPPRALISAAARRGGRREQFSFLFDFYRGAWLARGLGE